MAMSPEKLVYLADSMIMFSMFWYFFMHAFYYRPRKRLFHYVLSQISIISSLCYYLLFIEMGNVASPSGRIIRLPRYIDWVINTPLQLVTLANIGRISAINTYALCSIDILMIVSGLLGELTEGITRWSFFGLGSVCFFPLYIFLFEDFDYDTVANFAGDYAARSYYRIGRYLLSVWLLYPVVWIFSNTDHMSVFSTEIAYSILDFLSKVCFPAWVLLLLHAEYLKDHDPSLDAESGSTIIAPHDGFHT